MMKLDTVLNTAVRVSAPLETLYALLPLFLLLHMKVEFLFINRYDHYEYQEQTMIYGKAFCVVRSVIGRGRVPPIVEVREGSVGE